MKMLRTPESIKCHIIIPTPKLFRTLAEWFILQPRASLIFRTASLRWTYTNVSETSICLFR